MGSATHCRWGLNVFPYAKWCRTNIVRTYSVRAGYKRMKIPAKKIGAWQWSVLVTIIAVCLIVGILGAYSLARTPTLLVDGELIEQREGIELVAIDDFALHDSDLWKLPAFTKTVDEKDWWNVQAILNQVFAFKKQVVLGFRDKTQARWQVVADVGRMPITVVLEQVGVIYTVSVLYLFMSVSVFKRHATTPGFLCAVFLGTTALYLTSVAPVVHRPIILDYSVLSLLVRLFFVASTAQIVIVHFAMLFPERKRILRRFPVIVWMIYAYSITISALYLTEKIAFATTLPFVFFWILVMLGSFAHFIFKGQDEFLRKQVGLSFLAPLLVAIFFLMSIVAPWSTTGTIVDHFSLFSLMLPFAFILSLDNQKFYTDRLQSELSARREKSRIHRELHDTVLNDLASISIVAEGAQQFIDSRPQMARDRLMKVKEYATESSRQLRNFLWVIDDRQNTWADVVGSMRKMGYDLLQTANITFELTEHGDARLLIRPTTAVKHAIFQIFRECLINITKHATAHAVSAAISFTAAGIHLVVRDDGAGFDVENVGEGGHGLNNIRARLEEFDGLLTLTSRVGSGTEIVINLPVPAAGPDRGRRTELFWRHGETSR